MATYPGMDISEEVVFRVGTDEDLLARHGECVYVLHAEPTRYSVVPCILQDLKTFLTCPSHPHAPPPHLNLQASTTLTWTTARSGPTTTTNPCLRRQAAPAATACAATMWALSSTCCSRQWRASAGCAPHSGEVLVGIIDAMAAQYGRDMPPFFNQQQPEAAWFSVHAPAHPQGAHAAPHDAVRHAPGPGLRVAGLQDSHLSRGLCLLGAGAGVPCAVPLQAPPARRCV